MERRKFLIGMGAVAAGGTAALGTGAFEGAYVAADRVLEVGVRSDNQAILELNPTSEYASMGASEGGNGGGLLSLDLSNLNDDADTRLDEVFRVKNTTAEPVTLKILDGQESDSSVGDYNDGGDEDAFQIFAGSGAGQRIDSGSGVTLGPGHSTDVSVIAFLKENDPSELPEEMLVLADGTS